MKSGNELPIEIDKPYFKMNESGIYQIETDTILENLKEANRFTLCPLALTTEEQTKMLDVFGKVTSICGNLRRVLEDTANANTKLIRLSHNQLFVNNALLQEKKELIEEHKKELDEYKALADLYKKDRDAFEEENRRLKSQLAKFGVTNDETKTD